MSVWTREKDVFDALPAERQVKIEIVSSAYVSVFGQKAYVTMPVTTGRRYYEVLDRFGVKTIDELECRSPGALREEIILPNIEDGKAFAAQISKHRHADALIVPGVFEARKERWTQDEYMVLWLTLINSSVKALYLSDGWEYSNGGAMEFSQACAREIGLVGDGVLEAWENRGRTIVVYDHQGQRMDITSGAKLLANAIRDLSRRGYRTDTLQKELWFLVSIASEGCEFAHSTRHYDEVFKAAVSTSS